MVLLPPIGRVTERRRVNHWRLEDLPSECDFPSFLIPNILRARVLMFLEQPDREGPDRSVACQRGDACNHADPSRQTRDEAQANSGDRFPLFPSPLSFYN